MSILLIIVFIYIFTCHPVWITSYPALMNYDLLYGSFFLLLCLTNLFLGPPIFVVRLDVLIVRELRFPVATWPLWAAECMFWGYVQLLSLIVSVSILLAVKPWASWRKTHTHNLPPGFTFIDFFSVHVQHLNVMSHL